MLDFVRFRENITEKWRSDLKIAFLTLGCKVNSYETEKMKKAFEEAGHMIVAFDEKADAYIVNTCTVTNIADRKSRKMLHRAKRMNPEAVVAAAGCYVDSSEKKGERDESVDLFISNKDKEKLVEMVCDELKKRGLEDRLMPEHGECKMSQAALDEEHTRAYIKVQNGCNQYCTYCIIPFVRGELHSRTVEDVVSETQQLADRGFQEVVITGIHVSSYGVDKGKAGSFLELEGEPLLELLEAISEVEGIERIRLSSLEPRIITEKFVKRLSAIKKVCPHFHLSLQSGCDTVLKRMNRHYTTKDYTDGLEILRKYYDNPAVTTDIIVGFPQETEEEFVETCEFAKQVEFAQIHVFKYSRRQGTIADKMEGQITESIKSERSDRLLAIERELEILYQKKAVKDTEEVLIEEISEIDGKKYLTGYNERYIRVAIPAEKEEDALSRCNTIATVRILGHLNDSVVIGEFC